MWLERRLDLIRRHDAVILAAAPEMGVNRLISALADHGPLAWIVLEETDRGDDLALGNKLSDALRLALGSRLFPRATPYQAGVALLQRYRNVIAPITLAVSGVEARIALGRMLIQLAGPGCPVILAGERFEESDLNRLVRAAENVIVLGQDDLKLSLGEARAMTGERLGPAALRQHLDEVGCAYEMFVARMNIVLGVEFLDGDSMRSSVDDGTAVLPPPALSMARAETRCLEARPEARLSPETAAAALEEVAHDLHERGLHDSLWKLLERLPDRLKGMESVLFWRLSSAAWRGMEDQVRPEVDAYLLEHEAPELRALHAGAFLQTDNARHEVERAYTARKTPFTVYQQGRILASPSRGAELLKRSVRLAERSGRPYEVARAAGALTARLIDAGEYSEAARWGEWALSRFDELELSNTQRRLYILNNWAYARLLIGESVGLEGLLTEAEQDLAGAFPRLKALFRSTLGDYLLAVQRPEEALEYYGSNYEDAPRHMKGIRALNVVRALLETRQVNLKLAFELASEACTLSRIDGWEYHRPAVLALGMVLAFRDPASAVVQLGRVLGLDQTSLTAPQRAQAVLYLAYAKFLLGDSDGARKIVQEHRGELVALSPTGLRLLTGPEEAFREIWRWSQAETPPLDLRFLGRREVLANGERLTLSLQACSLLALLAYHPKGLEPGHLLSQLKWEGSSREALYAALSKLRRCVPISEAPYRLEVDFSADFIEAMNLLGEGKLRQALELYKAPLLADSDSPGIDEIRSLIDEMFRQATLASEDAEASFALAESASDDLELWEHALRLLNQNDPRALIAKARVTQLRREY
jgi:hypothetical protein